LALGGVGFSQLLAPLSVAVLGTVSGPDTAKASSLLALCQQLGGSIATASLVTLLARRTAFHQTILSASVTARRLGSLAFSPEPTGAMLARVARLVVQQATTLAFADAFWVLATVTLLLAPLVLLLRRAGRVAGVHLAAE
jgi:DHA2 family multidrug resistance protein